MNPRSRATRAPYSSLRGDALGHLWVAESKLPDARYEGTLGTVFDPGGHALGFAETSDGLRVLEIGAEPLLQCVTMWTRC